MLTSYLVANAIILPMTGWLASVFGRKNLLMISVVGFTSRLVPVRARADARLAHLLPHPAGRHRRRAAAALAGRAARGVPAARARQGHGLLGPRHRRRADSRTGARRLAHRQLQLALGVLHQHPGRHRVDRDDEDVHLRSAVHPAARSGSIDYWGIGMLAVGIGALQIVLDKGQEDDWFCVAHDHDADRHRRRHACRADLPRAAPRTIRSSICACSRSARYAVGVFLMTVVGFVLYGSLVLLPIMLQTLLGYPSLQAGIAMAPRGIGSFFMMPLTGCMTGRFDARKLLTMRPRRRRRHAALALAAEPAGRLLGHLLAAVRCRAPGSRCSSCR